MSQLAPDLFQRRYSDLVEIGRARLPELAPEWTDHNAHDPGITLMELLAWVSEAQLYSISRLRQDERLAYAAMLGIAASGTRPATGLIWPDVTDLNSPTKTYNQTVVVPQDTVINVVDAEQPTFRPQYKLLFAPGTIELLETRKLDCPGERTDHTITNDTGGVPYLPFGQRAGRGDVLSLSFSCRDKDGLFGRDRELAMGAIWPIGVMASSRAPAPRRFTTTAAEMPSPLTAVLITDHRRIDVKIASDSTQGLLTTGSILLDLDSVTDSPKRFTVELRSPSGFPRPPRVVRIEPNVIPIEQRRVIWREVHGDIKGWPDLVISLEERGLCFAAGEESVTVEVADVNGMVSKWTRCERLLGQGPHDNVYELDTKSGKVLFGNGINGRIPPAGSQVWVTYAVSDGEQGCVARNRKWEVAGFQGAFGVNTAPITGGFGPSGWLQQRREARRITREHHALVSADDLISAALKLPLLEVARAWVAQPRSQHPRSGTVTLVAMQSRTDRPPDSARPPETARWLASVRRRLAPKIPLGSRLEVVAPEYRDFTIVAQLEAEFGRDPSDVQRAVLDALMKRLALVRTSKIRELRAPGVPVTRRDVAAWIRQCEGVARVLRLDLLDIDGNVVDNEIAVPETGLPRWNASQSAIEVVRPGAGRTTS